MTNFNQIIDEIQQQKLAVASQIDEINALIAEKQAEIPELEAQLAGLVTLEEKTQELQLAANDVNINLNVNVNATGASGGGAVNHAVT